MPMKLTIIPLLATFALVGATYQATPLTRKAAVGDKATYKLTSDFEIQGSKASYRAKIVEKIIDITDGKITTETTTSDQVIILAGTEIPEDESTVTTTVTHSTGGILSIEPTEGDANAYRFASLTVLFWPKGNVEKGSKWQTVVSANPDQMTRITNYSYEIVDTETLVGHKTFKIKYATKEADGERPASANGHMWVDQSTGLLVKIEAKFKNVPLGDEVMDMSITQVLEPEK